MNDPSRVSQQLGMDKNVWTETARGYRLARLIGAAETTISRNAGVIANAANWKTRLYRANRSGYHQFRFFHSVSGASAQSLQVFSVPHNGPDPIAGNNQTLQQWALEPPIWEGTITFGSSGATLSNITALNLAGTFYEAVSRTSLHIKDRRVFWDPASGSASGYSVCMFVDMSSDDALLFTSPSGGTFTAGRLAVIGKEVQ